MAAFFLYFSSIFSINSLYMHIDLRHHRRPSPRIPPTTIRAPYGINVHLDYNNLNWPPQHVLVGAVKWRADHVSIKSNAPWTVLCAPIELSVKSMARRPSCAGGDRCGIYRDGTNTHRTVCH